MQLNEILEQIPVGGSFYRASKPEILYERIGALIERNGLGWARLEGDGRVSDWNIIPEQRVEEDIQAADWILQQSNMQERNHSLKKPRLRPLLTEKTRCAWTFYDQIESPKQP